MSTKYSLEYPGRGRRIDHVLVASVLLLTGLGLVTLYCSSYAFAQRRYGDALRFISRQLFLGGVGMVFFILAAIIDFNFLRKLVKPLVLCSIILCALTFVPGIG
jgi:cell division protein FtsW